MTFTIVPFHVALAINDDQEFMVLNGYEIFEERLVRHKGERRKEKRGHGAVLRYFGAAFIVMVLYSYGERSG